MCLIFLPYLQVSWKIRALLGIEQEISVRKRAIEGKRKGKMNQDRFSKGKCASSCGYNDARAFQYV
jgi:hypothetical protein